MSKRGASSSPREKRLSKRQNLQHRQLSPTHMNIDNGNATPPDDGNVTTDIHDGNATAPNNENTTNDIYGGDDAMHKQQDEIVNPRLALLAEDWEIDWPPNRLTKGHLRMVLEEVVEAAQTVLLKEYRLQYATLITENADLQEIIASCVQSRRYKDLRNYRLLRRVHSVVIVASKHDSTAVIGAEATLKSWSGEYVGDAADRLMKYINYYCIRQYSSPRRYAFTLDIVQSSGMGKSRMIDELSKSVLVIPMNLRPPTDSGFPPADDEVRTFLIDGAHDKVPVERYHAFLTALFETTANYVANIEDHVQKHIPDEDLESIPEKFRVLMAAGQEYWKRGEFRHTFYNVVIQRAKNLMLEVVPTPKMELTGHETSLTDAAKKAVKAVNKGWDLTKEKFSTPEIILAFDEAHVLTDVRPSRDYEGTLYTQLRSALQITQQQPIVSLFLSTRGRIPRVVLPSRIANSERLQRSFSQIRPFMEIGFDQLADKIADGSVTLSKVTSTEFMCKFGRPLFGSRYEHGDKAVRDTIISFAAGKLICQDGVEHMTEDSELSEGGKFACMAVRLALECNATTLESQAREREQVEKHMRVCIALSKNFETAVTIAPSEPILAEGALYVMRKTKLDVPRTLLHELERPGLDKGDRGELISMLLLMLARDEAELRTGGKRHVPLNTFIECLLKKPNEVLDSLPRKSRTAEDGEISFREAFKNAKIYFNHFIRIHDRKLISRKFLLWLISRGAAVLCALNQAGVDIIVPYLFWNDVLRRVDVGAMFVQAKNDGTFNVKPVYELFDAMNPYRLHFFDIDEIEPVPVIRIVFALASRRAAAVAVGPPERIPPMRDAKMKTQTVQKKRSPSYTAYDIWCAKTCSATFAVIPEDQNKTYASLLKIKRTFPAVYDEAEIGELKMARRTMNPGSGLESHHWTYIDPKTYN